ncbi:MAG: phosphoribosylglycinamide formyltransferase [Flavobacteriales bacterium]
MEHVNIALFASGQGSNVKALFEWVRTYSRIEIALLLTDREDAPVLHFCERKGIPYRVLPASEVKDGKSILSLLEASDIHMIALAGYFRKIPPRVVKAYRGCIVNVHPALLPNFGGKGMYGEHVHRAVLEKGHSKSGISVHLVDENYDSGKVLFQKSCPVRSDDTPQSLAQRVKELEHRYYPQQVIQRAEEILSE